MVIIPEIEPIELSSQMCTAVHEHREIAEAKNWGCAYTGTYAGIHAQARSRETYLASIVRLYVQFVMKNSICELPWQTTITYAAQLH